MMRDPKIGMPHKLSQRAEADLRDIYRYTLHAFGARQAERYLRELSRTFELLAEFPESGRRYDGETRQFLHGSHIILYRPFEGEVIIGRIFHGARSTPPSD